jgi:hypothetical protein
MARTRMSFLAVMDRTALPPRDVVAAWIIVGLVLCATIVGFVLDQAATIQ